MLSSYTHRRTHLSRDERYYLHDTFLRFAQSLIIAQHLHHRHQQLMPPRQPQPPSSTTTSTYLLSDHTEKDNGNSQAIYHWLKTEQRASSHYIRIIDSANMAV